MKKIEQKKTVVKAKRKQKEKGHPIVDNQKQRFDQLLDDAVLGMRKKTG